MVFHRTCHRPTGVEHVALLEKYPLFRTPRPPVRLSSSRGHRLAPRLCEARAAGADPVRPDPAHGPAPEPPGGGPPTGSPHVGPSSPPPPSEAARQHHRQPTGTPSPPAGEVPAPPGLGATAPRAAPPVCRPLRSAQLQSARGLRPGRAPRWTGARNETQCPRPPAARRLGASAAGRGTCGRPEDCGRRVRWQQGPRKAACRTHRSCPASAIAPWRIRRRCLVDPLPPSTTP
mmetsp:Transcript_19238/g.48880  ORF Transcript_19238/g.48880 Transcript_19238/m.48880 type:complete len:232 (+) Transcript_19238:1006-1701(+)